MVAAAVIGGSIVSGVMSSSAQSDAAEAAAGAQTAASDASIAESRRQFDKIQGMLAPYTNAGANAVQQQGNLIGANGPLNQVGAITDFANSPLYGILAGQGENAIRQNAAATGGLRGGNIQGALAQFRPNLLNSMIQQQFQNLGSLTSVGQNAAAGVGNAGMNSSNQVINALQQSGAAQAGNALAQGKIEANNWSNLGSGIGFLGSQLGGSGFGNALMSGGF